jgi:hypothetical protein
MTAFSAAAETIDDPPRVSAWSRAWNAIESRLATIADHANPILVKETRQALKSRQFIITFLVVLLGCWIVSFVGIAVVGPQIYFAAAGPGMLAAYYTILIVPLTLIVPFTAFRSLAAEQEENTFDLLSITALGSRQIVTGKLSSSLVQMVVYLSAVSPCIAFTFLLRGVDAVTVAVLLAVSVLASVGLSMLSLLIGAVARVHNSQVIISVALVLLLTGASSGMWSLGMDIIGIGSSDYRDPQFVQFAVFLLSFYVATFGLIHSAAAAQVAFVSENRSTPLRWWMMAHQACLLGLLGAIVFDAVRQSGGFGINLGGGVLWIGAMFGAGYWYLVGMLMTGEWPHLSRRVQRSLPTSTLWRPFVSLLNPGPGSGYLFAIANLTAIILFALGATLLFNQRASSGRPSFEQGMYFAIFAWSYVVAFLGFGSLIINALRKWAYVPMTAAFLVHAVLFLSAIGVPTVIQMTSRELRNSGYTLWQMTNPVWTLSELVMKSQGVDNVQASVLIYILPTAAFIALMLNMRAIGTELLLQRIPVPVRIVEDEAELKAATSRGPKSPWDVDDEEATALKT